jgi:hypothetical protein
MYLVYVSSRLVQALDELVRADLQNCRDSYFGWLIFSSVVVALGVILEIPEVIYETRDIFPRIFWKQKQQKHRDIPDWVKLVALIGLILVALGVAGEGIAEAYVSRIDSTLQTFNDILLGDTSKEAAFALERAAAANRRAEELKKESEQARKDSEHERLARVKVEARVAWRHLTERQKAEFGNKLRNFANQVHVSMWYQAGDTEAAMFAAELTEALRAANIAVAPPGGILDLAEGGHFGGPVNPMETGVILQSTKDELSRSLADAIIKELIVRGFDATRRKSPPVDKPLPQVWVTVQPRPEGPQGEFKLKAGRHPNVENRSYRSAE